jgi:hypothetical protein
MTSHSSEKSLLPQYTASQTHCRSQYIEFFPAMCFAERMMLGPDVDDVEDMDVLRKCG